MFTTLPDISLLMVIGSIPDYLQGLIKLFWVITGKARRPAAPAASPEAAPTTELEKVG